MPFTFKTEKSTGRYRSFYPDAHYIKMDKKQVGKINDKDFTIRLMVQKEVTKEDPAPFKWITLKHVEPSLLETKAWLNKNFTAITTQYQLYKLD